MQRVGSVRGVGGEQEEEEMGVVDLVKKKEAGKGHHGKGAGDGITLKEGGGGLCAVMEPDGKSTR